MNKELQNQLSRMKSMMTYGLATENKNCQFSNVEYDKVAANGKHYAIIREGSKYYIKVSDKKEALKEDYNYIGGFCNRSRNEYNSYANALKQFELKLMSIQENYNKNNGIVIESWNPYKKEELTVESTEKMRKEIARQKEIINNATKIFEGKNVATTISEECVGKECAATQKDNIKKTKTPKGEPTGKGGDPFTQSPEAEFSKTQKTNSKKEFKPVIEEEEELAWNDNEDYMDKSHGTEIGSSEPFEEVVAECDAMHNCDNQNCPKPGVGEVGDDDPFDQEINEDVDFDVEDVEDDVDFDDEDVEDDVDFDVEDVDFDDEAVDFDDENVEDDELEGGFDDDTVDDEVEIEDNKDSEIDARLSAIEDAIAKISDKLGVNEFEDDELYGPEEDGEDELEFDVELGDDEEDEEDEDDELTECVVIETPAYKRLMREESDFGKHPAYRKEVMTLPSHKHTENAGYYDMNDESAESDAPFGQKIGSSAPFTETPQAINNAIAEAVKRVIAKRKNL